MSTKLARVQATARNLRRKQQDAAGIFVEKLSMSVGAGLLGLYDGARNAKGEPLPRSIGKVVPIKLVTGVAAYIAAAMSKGFISRGFEGIGDASIAIYEYKVAQAGALKQANPFVQGDDEIQEADL